MKDANIAEPGITALITSSLDASGIWKNLNVKKGRLKMRSIVIPQMMPITGSTPEEAAHKFNEAIMELAPLRPTFVREGNTYYIQYSVEIKEAETISDEHELRGERHTCKECPHLVRDRNRFGDIDARKVHGTCTMTGQRVWFRDAACDIYYEERGNE